ncbi:hypothetical protein CEXT_518861 [Caerostris extrusa]|uniref:Uncharacterized protein n=1 Tax=Caerostris extrusa TaxID=172846 RepID=A0AAV4NMJ7_CAEEX|nr:hypothetical protein CEXT_518861 [Caerostris extrusa]
MAYQEQVLEDEVYEEDEIYSAAVAKFRPLTVHDCLKCIVSILICVLHLIVVCDSGLAMTAACLVECSTLNDLDCIVGNYWETHFLMT